MRPKTRYNIRLAMRKGINVRQAGVEGLATWYGLYVETAMRNRLYPNDISYFQSMFASKIGYTGKGVSVFLLIAYHDDTPLAAMFLVVSAHRATYLYGASSSSMRHLMPTYALQWEAMRLAKAAGCKEYDMFGVAPCPDPSHPMYGLYKFKNGFGGEIYHQLGCWDYPLDKEQYDILLAREMTMHGYYAR
ncbi:MAG: lipid II:glycine glycyltransferase FemX [Prevotella sp.]